MGRRRCGYGPTFCVSDIWLQDVGLHLQRVLQLCHFWMAKANEQQHHTACVLLNSLLLLWCSRAAVVAEDQ